MGRDPPFMVLQTLSPQVEPGWPPQDIHGQTLATNWPEYELVRNNDPLSGVFASNPVVPVKL